MSMTPRPPIPSFIPKSAPFTPEQRTWLNGLLAGLFGLEEASRRSPPRKSRLLPGLLPARRHAPAPAEGDTKSTTARLGTILRCRCRSA